MKSYFPLYTLTIAFMINVSQVTAQITRIWLTHRTDKPSHIVINWESQKPGNSEVYFYCDKNNEYHIIKNENVTLHHIEIPLGKTDVAYYYRVQTGNEKSETYSFKSYPSEQNELRIAIVGNWGYSDNLDLSKLITDDPHLLLTLGDNVANLHEDCGIGVKDCVKPFLRLIDAAPGIFHSTPFMPILGNHDREIRPRGDKPPLEAVYDIDATAYRKFFELPGDEWKWKFEIPDFELCFIALDLNHINDLGSTWQTCHDFHIGSEQFNWFKTMMETRPKGYVITLNNEKNGSMRAQGHGLWQELFQKGTAVITGYGYFAERAEVDGFPYFNTSLKAGDMYPDEYSKMIQQVGGYILLRCSKNNPVKLEMKKLNGEVIDSKILHKQ